MCGWARSWESERGWAGGFDNECAHTPALHHSHSHTPTLDCSALLLAGVSLSRTEPLYLAYLANEWKTSGAWRAMGRGKGVSLWHPFG